jgi:hypothetical protein
MCDPIWLHIAIVGSIPGRDSAGTDRCPAAINGAKVQTSDETIGALLDFLHLNRDEGHSCLMRLFPGQDSRKLLTAARQTVQPLSSSWKSGVRWGYLLHKLHLVTSVLCTPEEDEVMM